MKKSLKLVTAVLFACSAFVARADGGPRLGMGASPNDDNANEQEHQGQQQEQEHENALSRGNHDDERAFLVFGNMIGVDGSFLSSDTIRGVMGDELPWTVAMARGALSASGRLRINVRGLVFTNDPSVPADKQGKNDEATFRGLVSCLTEKSGGGTMTVNVMTDPFPASPQGNAEINGQVALPAQCLAPIIFVMSGSEDKWFAVVGTETAAATQ